MHSFIPLLINTPDIFQMNIPIEKYFSKKYTEIEDGVIGDYNNIS